MFFVGTVSYWVSSERNGIRRQSCGDILVSYKTPKWTRHGRVYPYLWLKVESSPVPEQQRTCAEISHAIVRDFPSCLIYYTMSEPPAPNDWHICANVTILCVKVLITTVAPRVHTTGAHFALTLLLRGVAAAGQPRRFQHTPPSLHRTFVRLRPNHLPCFLQIQQVAYWEVLFSL